MKCFYHQDRHAIGTCKSCQKGLCPECAVDLSQGLACKSHCEEDVQNIIQLIQNNIKLSPVSSRMISASRRGGILAAGFCMVIGAVFVGWGLHDEMSFSVALGACFAVFGVISLIRVLRMTSPKIRP